MQLTRLAMSIVVVCGFVTTAAAQTSTLGQQSMLKAGRSTAIAYNSVAEARQDLEAREGTRVSKEYGWTIIEDRKAAAVWSFTPENHPAHPTMVKRTVLDRGRTVEIVMDGQCEATREACEKAIKELKRRTFKYQSILAGHGPRMGGAAVADLPALESLLQVSRAVR